MYIFRLPLVWNSDEYNIHDTFYICFSNSSIDNFFLYLFSPELLLFLVVAVVLKVSFPPPALSDISFLETQ